MQDMERLEELFQTIERYNFVYKDSFKEEFKKLHMKTREYNKLIESLNEKKLRELGEHQFIWIYTEMWSKLLELFYDIELVLEHGEDEKLEIIKKKAPEFEYTRKKFDEVFNNYDDELIGVFINLGSALGEALHKSIRRLESLD